MSTLAWAASWLLFGLVCLLATWCDTKGGNHGDGR
jgi:hypothetical protein